MDWLIDLLFSRRQGTVRVGRDHLPGLTPPKPAKFIPHRVSETEPKTEDINEMYKKFKSKRPDKQRSDKRRGFNF